MCGEMTNLVFLNSKLKRIGKNSKSKHDEITRNILKRIVALDYAFHCTVRVYGECTVMMGS
jgi:hypothetical protein